MSAASFQRAYARWQDFSRYLDPRFSSGFWRRVTGVNMQRVLIIGATSAIAEATARR